MFLTKPYKILFPEMKKIGKFNKKALAICSMLITFL